MLRSLGARLRGAGEALEAAAYRMGQPKGQPAVAAFRPAKTDYQTETQDWLYEKGVAEGKVDAVVEIPSKFVAPSALVSSEAAVENGAGVWYHAQVAGSVSIGSGAAVLEHAQVSGASGQPTVLGAGVLVYPKSKVGAGVTIGDRSVVKSGAVVESDVTIGEDSVIGQGAVVAKGTKVGSREVWSGVPAAKVGTVDNETLQALSEAVQEISQKGLFHQTEHNKDIFEIHYERQALKDRKEWAEDFIEDHDNSPMGHLPIYLNMDHFPDKFPERRGLIYNKGDDKGREGNAPA